MTAIEELWNKARTDPDNQRMNGNLLKQATYICPACGHEKKLDNCTCSNCGNMECDNA